MATSVMTKQTRPLNTLTKSYTGRHTIPNNGYLRIDELPELQGKYVVGSIITTWGANSGAISLAFGGGPQSYIMGNAGAYITDFAVRYLYYDV